MSMGARRRSVSKPTLPARAPHTISLDGAPSTGPRQYNWGKKIRIQMTRQELPVVGGMLLGFIPKCEFTSHGPQNDKGFSIEDQGDNIFIHVFAKDQGVRAVPVTPEDAYRVATLFLRQLRKEAPWMTCWDAVQTVRAVIGRRKVAPQQPRA